MLRLTDSQEDEYDADVGDASGVVRVDVPIGSTNTCIDA